MRLPRLRTTFPLGAPTWPDGVERPPLAGRTGLDYDTAWARRYGARVARAVFVDDVLRPLINAVGSPDVHGLDRLADLDETAIFAANHHSHLDTGVILTSLPARWRHKTVVAAASDTFFATRAMSAFSALTIGAIPIERHRVNRRSSDLVAALLGEGWSLIIFPEGGRSPDGWAREFRGGAAYLAVKCVRPVVPVYIEGTRGVLKKGQTLPAGIANPFRRGGPVKVNFGKPMRPVEGEDARRFAVRIQDAIAELGDEWSTDWWSARRRAAAGRTPGLGGPTASPWRRAWRLEEGRRAPAGAKSWP
ncbi:MAG TPA: lysophospholipid acyltransferase family protein [Acidimicrobiales bacterium]|nr:lysophospholipid acyltransferase family protein [Acidimicrobiales bacterium]